MATAARTVDAYIGTFPEDVQAVLRTLRETIRKAVPDAEEGIAYGMPAYRLDGLLVYFAAWKQHYALYPATGSFVEAFADRLAAYEVSKGTIKFPYDRRVPVRLITAIVKRRAVENRERAASKPPKARRIKANAKS